MKKIIIASIAAGLMASLATAGVDVTVDVASAYVFRGTTFNDGAVIQPGIEAGGLGIPEAVGSVAVGAWANVDLNDYDGSLETSEFSEIDWYASYSLPSFVDGLDAYVGYCEYTYPSGGGDADKEANVGVGYEIAGVGIGATYYRLVGGSYVGDSWYELAISYDADIADTGISAGVAADVRFLDSVTGESGWNDYTLGGSVSYAISDVWSTGVSVTHIGQCDDNVLAEGVGAYDVELVGMFSLAASF